MDVVGAVAAIRVLTDAVHNNINVVWNVPVNGTQKNIFPQVVCWFLSLGFVLVYAISPLPPLHSTNPLASYADNLLNTLVVWLVAMGADNLLKYFNKG